MRKDFVAVAAIGEAAVGASTLLAAVAVAVAVLVAAGTGTAAVDGGIRPEQPPVLLEPVVGKG